MFAKSELFESSIAGAVIRALGEVPIDRNGDPRHSAGIGLFSVSHWDNGYPGPSDLYVPPNVGGPNTVYAQRVYFAD